MSGDCGGERVGEREVMTSLLRIKSLCRGVKAGGE